MKLAQAIIIILVLARPAFARHIPTGAAAQDSVCPGTFIDVSSGINNNGGLLGGGVDVHLVDDISVTGGVGLLSTWGYKVYTGVKCYLKPCHLGWAFGGGFTYSTGIPEYIQDMPTQSGNTETVTLNLLPQANVYAAAFRHWHMGRHHNRMYLQLGITRSLMNTKFRQTAGTPITPLQASVMKALAPGGVIIGLGFCFATR